MSRNSKAVGKFKRETLERIDSLIKIQGTDGNWNYDEYMRGMYNGMLVIESCVTDTMPTPDFKTTPDEYIADAAFREKHPVLKNAWEEYMILKD